MNAFRERVGQGAPVVIAHRGDSSHAPENTLEAAVLGHAAGAFAWELDVHLSRDGVPVVHHDDSLARTTDVAVRFADDPRANLGFRVADFDWEEIRTLDAGSWFLDPSQPRSAGAFGTLSTISAADRAKFSSGSIRVPSLTQALELTRELNWLVNVELKTFPVRDPALLDAVLSAIELTGTADRVLLSSFDHEDVMIAAARRPDIPTGALFDTPLARCGEYAKLLGVDFLHSSCEAFGPESRAYQGCQSPKNLRPLGGSGPEPPRLVYTVNDVRPDGLANHLRELGVAGAFTDDPKALVGLWN